MNVDHFRRDAFYMLKSAVSCIQSPECSKDDVDMAIRNVQRGLAKLEDFENAKWPETQE